MAEKTTELLKFYKHMEIKGFKKPEYDIDDENIKKEEYEKFLAIDKNNKNGQNSQANKEGEDGNVL